MRCQTCGYALWGLPEPRCPECGTAFDLRDYAFDPGSVAFTCPHCGHPHAGQGEHHLPSSDNQAICRKCAEPMTVAQMSVVPLTDDAAAFPSRLTPWERHRASRGPWRSRLRRDGLLRACLRSVVDEHRAWWATCRRTILDPAGLAQSIGPHSREGQGYLFTVETAGITAAVQVLLAGVLVLVWAVLPKPSGRLVDLVTGVFDSMAPILIFGWFLVSLWIVFALVGGCAAHLGVLATGQCRGGVRRTLAAVAYGQGPLLLASIPLFGLPVAYFWCKVSTIAQLSAVQGISTARAAVACLWLPVSLLMLSAMALVAVALLSLSW